MPQDFFLIMATNTDTENLNGKDESEQSQLQSLIVQIQSLCTETRAEREDLKKQNSLHIDQVTQTMKEECAKMQEAFSYQRNAIQSKLKEVDILKEEMAAQAASPWKQDMSTPNPERRRFDAELSVISAFQSNGARPKDQQQIPSKTPISNQGLYTPPPYMTSSPSSTSSGYPQTLPNPLNMSNLSSTPTFPHNSSSFRSSGRSNHSFDDISRPKLATFDGSDDWEVFIHPFERMARRYGWTDPEKLEHLHDCMRKEAVKFICTLPQQIQDSYVLIVRHLADRFGRIDPPSTLRKQLADIKQRKETTEEFAQEVRRLVAKAYPGIRLEMQEELAAEAFLRGIKNPKLAFEAMNRNPKTIVAAIEEVVRLEHNFKATIGRDQERTASSSQGTRRVSWQDTATTEGNAKSCLTKPPQDDVSGHKSTVENRLQNIEALLLKLSQGKAPVESQPSTVCYTCKGNGHYSRECPTRGRSPSRNRSPSPSPFDRETKPVESQTGKVCYTCNGKGHYSRECPSKRSRSPEGSRPRSPSPRPGRITLGRIKRTHPSIIIGANVDGHKVEALVDTGADATIMSEELAKEIGVNPGTCKVTLYNAEDGAEMQAVGGVTVTLSVAGSSWRWPVYVAPIRDNFLIGLDFLQEVDATIIAKQGDVVINGIIVPGIASKGESSHTVLSNTDEVIPPRSEKIIVGRVACQDSTRSALFEPASNKNGLFHGAAVVNVKGMIPVMVLNPNMEPVSIREGTHLGKLMDAHIEVARVTDEVVTSLESSRGRVIEEVPKHLEKLVEESSDLLHPDEKAQLADTLVEFQDVFANDDEDLGCFKGVQHKIPTGDSKAIRQPSRRTPLGFQAEEEDHLRKLLKNGTVVPSTSEWASPVVLVRKKDGGLRWCVDYRKINDVTRKDAFPLPRVEDCLDTLSGASLFSTLDLQSGYHQIGMDPEDQAKTAFITRYGLFEFTRMPFGLCGAPGTFQRAMELVLSGLQWKKVLVYLDDVILTGTGFDEHLLRLRDILSRFREHGLKLKPSKCHLFRKEVLFLGHTVSAQGIATNPKLVEVIRNWKTPTNVKEMLAFLGLTNYYRRFIPHYQKRLNHCTN